MPRTDKSSTIDPPFHAWPEHPLFPVDEGDKSPEVAYVQITRIDQGQQYYGPILRADELTTTEEIFELFGGGHYELWARAHSKNHADRPGNVTKKKRFMLPGRSKPISKDPTPEEIRRAEGSGRGAGEVAPAPAPAAAPSSSAPGETLLLALLNMQQSQAQQSADAAQRFMALMMQMITDSKKESVSQMQQMTTMMMTFSQSQQQSMVTMLTAMMQNRGGGPDEFAKYADLMRQLGVGGVKTDDEPKDEPAGFGKMLEDAADFVQGVAALRGAAPAPPNGAPVPPPLPGSAAAVAAELGVK